MKTTININGKDVEITLTAEQIEKVKKFNVKITDRIKNMDDVFEYHGISKSDFEAACKGLSVDEIAYRKLKLALSALNEGWKPNWDDENEYKYHPYFNMESSGVGFSDSLCGYRDTSSGVGSRLCLKSRELAEYAGTTFLPEYKEFLTLNNN